MKAALAAFAEKSAASKEIRRRLTASPAWQTAEVVYGFYPLRSEPDWMHEMDFRGKTLAFPQMRGGEMHFLFGGEPHAGLHGVREPAGGEPAPPPDLVLVPGLAYDAGRFRLGRGGGFYDRWLEPHQGIPTLGLCFACQIVKKIPMERHDARVNAVLTEAGFIQENPPQQNSPHQNPP